MTQDGKMARSKNVDSWIAELDPEPRRIASALRELILEAEPGLKESIKWSNPTYEKAGNACYLTATETYVTLGFFKGAHLTDPESRIEGTGRNMRHVKFRSPEDIPKGQVKAWVSEAVALNERAGQNPDSSFSTNGQRGSE